MGTSTEELSSDIARTREDLTRDVDALQDKVSPSAIMERRKTAVRHRWSSMKDKVMGSGATVTGHGESALHGVSGAASDAGSAIENRVEGSPLAAGLVAFGAGLVVAGLVPASKVEAQGAQRLKDVAQEHAQPVMDEARSVAQDMGEQLKDKASQAADEVRSSAKTSAERVKDEAPTGSSDGSDGPGDQATHRATGPVV
jgi:hypothetical protein